MMTSPYFDINSEYFQEYFAKGQLYQDYVAAGEEQQITNVRNYESLIALTDEQKALLATYTMKMKVLVLSGIWCGDCTRQIPMFKVIEEASSHVEMRYLDSRTYPELHDKLRINGALKVPVVVVFSEDFFELARFGDRHLSVYRRKAATELGPTCETGLIPPSDDALATELSEWCDFFERLQLMLKLSPMLRKRYGM
jgi:hypothetical protein